MGKALLMSILVAMIVIPMRAAGDPRPPRAARRTVIHVAVFVAVWAYALLYLLPALKG